MTTTYVTFDKRTGQILSVHHGAIDANAARATAQHHRQQVAEIGDEHIEVIPVPSDVVDADKLYKVDVARKMLVVASAQDGGVGFGFGEASRPSSGA